MKLLLAQGAGANQAAVVTELFQRDELLGKGERGHDPGGKGVASGFDGLRESLFPQGVAGGWAELSANQANWRELRTGPIRNGRVCV